MLTGLHTRVRSNSMSNAELTRGLAEWVFKPIAEQFGDYPHPLAGFAAERGSCYRGELMVVGRATHGGWDRDLRELSDADEREELARRLSEESLSWVIHQWHSRDDYNSATSAFWRVVRRVTLSLVDGASESDWSNYIVWSNLYKVTRSEPPGGMNPPAPLMRAQRRGCKKLLKREIEIFRPRRVLFLTRGDWAEEVFDIPSEAQEPADTRFVERIWDEPVSSESGAPFGRFVVAGHPQGKGDDLCTEEVLAAFGS